MKILYFYISQILTSFILAFRLTFIIVLLSFSNADFLKLVFITVIVDITLTKLLSNYSTIRNIKKYTKSIPKIKYNKVENNKFIQDFIQELKKYKQYIYENIQSDKEIVIIEPSDLVVSNYVAYPIFNWKSYIILPSNYDFENKIQKILLAHEMAHCFGNDVNKVIIQQIRLICIICPLLAVLASGISFKSLIVILFSLVLIASQKWYNMYTEILANNYAIEIIQKIDPQLDFELCIKTLLHPLNLKFSDKKTSLSEKILIAPQIKILKQIEKIKSSIYGISPFNNIMLVPLWSILILSTFNVENNFFVDFNISFKSVTIIALITLLFSFLMISKFKKRENNYKWKFQKTIGI